MFAFPGQLTMDNRISGYWPIEGGSDEPVSDLEDALDSSEKREAREITRQQIAFHDRKEELFKGRSFREAVIRESTPGESLQDIAKIAEQDLKGEMESRRADLRHTIAWIRSAREKRDVQIRTHFSRKGGEGDSGERNAAEGTRKSHSPWRRFVMKIWRYFVKVPKGGG